MSEAPRVVYWRSRNGGTQLFRRGVDHGSYRAIRSEAADARALWNGDRPICIPGFLQDLTRRHAKSIRSAQALFERLAEQRADPSEEIWRRIGVRSSFLSAGSSIDTGDPREIEKVHADLETRDEMIQDLYAKFSWIRPELDDRSLRIRFSFGEERAGDWRRDPKRRAASDRLCEAVFPESAAIASHRKLKTLLASCSGEELQMSERIVFANAPGGGARFHHDAEKGQRGVLYAQLAGRTAWLAIPKRQLAESLRQRFPGRKGFDSGPALLRRMDEDDAAMDRLLNSTPELTRTLAEEGWLIVLRRGDLLLLPSHGPNDCAWHSVFALGKRPSLAHSYGLFAKAPLSGS